LEAHRHVLGHRQPGEERERLEHHRRGAQHAVERLAAVQQLPVDRARQPGEQAEQRALAAPRRPDQGHHLVLAHGERHVAQRLEVLAVREPKALRHVLRLEEHRAGRHVSSPKRVCAHPMRERHTKRFQLTTIMLISAIPPASSGKLAWAVASLIKLPSPLVTRSRPATCMYSATIEPFQAPPAAVTHPVTSAGNAAGKYRDRQRARRGSRNTVAASFNCSGTAATAEITLNRIYHWPASTISATAPSPSPTPIRRATRCPKANRGPRRMTGPTARNGRSNGRAARRARRYARRCSTAARRGRRARRRKSSTHDDGPGPPPLLSSNRNFSTHTTNGRHRS